jgi:hypothetical protein
LYQERERIENIQRRNRKKEKRRKKEYFSFIKLIYSIIRPGKIREREERVILDSEEPFIATQ